MVNLRPSPVFSLGAGLLGGSASSRRQGGIMSKWVASSNRVVGRRRVRVVALLAGLASLASVLAVVAPPAGAVANDPQPGQVVSPDPVSWTPHVLDGYVNTF